MTSPDVLIVRPWARSAVPPDALVEDSLGVGYVVSALRAEGYEVAVVDAFTLRFDDEQMIECIAMLRPRMLGISLHSFADYRHAITIAEGVKTRLPRTYCAVGGEHATFTARELLERHRSIDAVVMGEGERTLVELADAVLRERKPEKAIAGALLRTPSGKIEDGGFREAIGDLDLLPYPAKDTVELAMMMGRPVALSVLTGRGCTHKCTFCTAHTYLRLGGGAVWRRRSPTAVVAEMERLFAMYGGKPLVHRMVQFQDVIFLGTSPAALRWANEFVSELEARDLHIPYYIMTRAEAILANAELLPRLARSGLSSVEIGIESGIDRILLAYSKMNSAARTEEAIALLQAHNVCYDASGFIMFDPRITLEELRENAHFLRRLGHATWDRYVTRLQVFPGTAIKEQLISDGLYDDRGELDNVYAYRFRDPRVAAVAEYAFMYDGLVHALDNAIHGARDIVAQRRRAGDEALLLRSAIDLAEDVYRDHFLALLDLAEHDALPEGFELLVRRLLVRAGLLVDHLRTPSALPAAG